MRKLKCTWLRGKGTCIDSILSIEVGKSLYFPAWTASIVFPHGIPKFKRNNLRNAAGSTFELQCYTSDHKKQSFRILFTDDTLHREFSQAPLRKIGALQLQTFKETSTCLEHETSTYDHLVRKDLHTLRICDAQWKCNVFVTIWGLIIACR